MASIRFEHVSKHFGQVRAIDDIHFDIRDQEFLVLVGPSGCGKSTLLRMIAGLEDISSGTLYIDEKAVNHLPPKDRDIAIVFQNYALYPHMTAYDNMAFGLKIRGWSKAQIHEKVMQTAALLEIVPLLDRKPKAMSGGQRQRVAIGRAMVRNPKVFLFDEPLSNLDAKLRGQMRLEIARLHRTLRTTIVYVTHDQVEAMTLGDRIAVMQHGKILQLDTPQQVYHHPVNRFVAGFIGSPPMNFLQGKIHIHDDDISFFDPTGTLRARSLTHPALRKFDGRDITIGVRCEHIWLESPSVIHPIEIEVDVQLVERLGHESFAICALGEQSLTVRLPGHVQIMPQTRISLYLDSEKLYFFDPDTDETL